MATTNTVMKKNCGDSGCESKVQCCSDCGAVECLCRPRFFAGQLLSEQDLNRLDQYIKNKNRLHNRSQHGWGVVNGLKVLCDPCGDVKVSEGYAVGPCGDDIVVCQPTSVNICDLIRKCKKAHPEPQCDPVSTARRGESHCEEVEETWVLTISYEEWASRGVTALRGNTCSTQSCAPTPSSSSCSCGAGAGAGASGSCSCGSHSKSSLSQSAGRKNRGAPPECEPTVICEGFSFDVYKKPVEEREEDDGKLLPNLTGSFADAFNCCAESLMNTIPPMPDLGSKPELLDLARSISNWCCTWRKNLLDYFLTHPNTSCEVIDFLKRVDCPSMLRPGSFATDFIVSFLSLMAAWAEGLKVCLCLSLLPPTPEATCDTRVPLATVRIRAGDCKVLSICNWTTERKIMVTWPAMGHWLGVFNVGEFFHGLMDKLCCNSLLSIFEDILRDLPQGDQQGGVNMNASSGIANPAVYEEEKKSINFASEMSKFSGEIFNRFSLSSVNKKSENFANFIGKSLERGNEPLHLGAVLNSVSPRFRMPTNDKDLSDVEAKNIPLLLISELVVKPLANSILGEDEASRQMEEWEKNHGKNKNEKSKNGKAKAYAKGSDANMETELASIKAQMEKQMQEIANIKTQLADNK